jgi:hypothetical protein
MLDEIKKTHKEVFNSMGLGNTYCMDVLSWASQEFDEDGVHLTKEAGKIFVGGILSAAEAIFNAGFIDMTTRKVSQRRMPMVCWRRGSTDWRLPLMNEDGTTTCSLPEYVRSSIWLQTS